MLAKNITLTTQPTNNLCGITCLAMAIDLPVHVLSNTLKNLGVDLTKPFVLNSIHFRKICAFYNVLLEPASIDIQKLSNGLYFVAVPCLSGEIKTSTHCILLKKTDKFQTIYDPQPKTKYSFVKNSDTVLITNAFIYGVYRVIDCEQFN